MEFAIRQTVDLGCENPVLRYAQPLEYGDSCAHRWIVTVERDGAAADLSAMSAKCYVTRAAGDAERAQGVTSVTLPLETAIDAQGGTISCVFQEGCYGGVGAFAAIMRLSDASGATVTAAKLTARLDRSTSDAVYDPEGLVPSLDALLAQIETIEAATEAANTAAANANAKAAAANTATGNANTATGNANAGADNANKAAAKINGMTIDASGLSAGASPTAALSEVDGHYHIALGIPRGDTGATPQISVQVQTGEAGSEAQVSVSGTAENPVIHLTIPRGDVGDIGTLKINGKSPDASGAVTLTPEDLEAAAAEEVNQLKSDIDLRLKYSLIMFGNSIPLGASTITPQSIPANAPTSGKILSITYYSSFDNVFFAWNPQGITEKGADPQSIRSYIYNVNNLRNSEVYGAIYGLLLWTDNI